MLEIKYTKTAFNDLDKIFKLIFEDKKNVAIEYINKLRIRTPREDEDGFDVAQMGTLMHSCFESFAKNVQGDKNPLFFNKLK